MSKELVDIQDLKSAFVSHCKELGCDENYIKVCENKFSNIETALINYEKGIENAQGYKPRSSMQALFDLESLAIMRTHKSFWKLPEQLANDVRKDLKALKIIKEKRVDVSWFRECLSCANPLEVYNDRYDKIRSWDGKDYHFMQLTQEEYDLLKEVLL